MSPESEDPRIRALRQYLMLFGGRGRDEQTALAALDSLAERAAHPVPEGLHPVASNPWVTGTRATLAATPAPLREVPETAHDHTPTCGCLPIRVVVDQHGHYWRDYGDHWSMCPVSTENVATTPVTEFYRLGEGGDFEAAPLPDAEGLDHWAVSRDKAAEARHRKRAALQSDPK